MKKKFLVAALAATMVVGSTFGVLAEDVDASKTYDGGQIIDGTESWNTADGDNYLISDTPVAVKFTNEPFLRKDENGADQNWFNFVFETVASDSAKGITMRADAFAWTYGDSETEPAYVVETSWGDDWGSFAEVSKADITITATKSDANTVKFEIAFGSAATETYTITYPGGVPSDLRFHVGADGAKITVNSVTYGSADTKTNTNTNTKTNTNTTVKNPTTNDMAPIAAFTAVAVIACAAVVVSRKKVTE